MAKKVKGDIDWQGAHFFATSPSSPNIKWVSTDAFAVGAGSSVDLGSDNSAVLGAASLVTNEIFEISANLTGIFVGATDYLGEEGVYPPSAADMNWAPLGSPAAMPTEVDGQLDSLYAAAVAYYGEFNEYAPDAATMSWAPTGANRVYGYFYGTSVFPPTKPIVPGDWATRAAAALTAAGVTISVTTTTYLAAAIAYLGNGIWDIWTEDEGNVRVHVSEHIYGFYYGTSVFPPTIPGTPSDWQSQADTALSNAGVVISVNGGTSFLAAAIAKINGTWTIWTINQTNTHAYVVGANDTTSGVVLGNSARSRGKSAIAIGKTAHAEHHNSVAIGEGASTSRNNDGVIGTADKPIDWRGFGDLNWPGGHCLQLGPWYQDNVAASQTAVALDLAGAPVSRLERIAIRSGSVIGVVVYSNAARSAGTLTIEVTVNGVGSGLTAVLNGTNTTTKVTTQSKDTTMFAAGDRIGATITTDGSWAPTTADITVEVLIEE